jgi:predicted ATPase
LTPILAGAPSVADDGRVLRSVRIENYKCLEDTGEVKLAPVTVVIGKNDTGKSSFLEAIWALSEAVDASAWSGTELAERIRADASAGTVRWDTRWSRAESELAYAVSLRRAGDHLRLASEELIVDGNPEFGVRPDGATFNAHVTPSGPLSHPLLTAESQARGVGSTSDVLAMLRGVSPPFFLANRPAGALAAMLDELLGEDRKAFDQLEAALCAAFPNVRGISLRRLKPVPAPRTLMFKIGEATTVRADQVSGGVLAFTALLAEVFRAGDAPHSLLLIEEPENGVHPRRLQLLAEHIKVLGRRTQIVVATHSPYLLDYFPPSAVRVFGRTREGRVVVRELESIPLVSEWLADGHSLGELWFNVGEDKILGLDDGGSTGGE